MLLVNRFQRFFYINTFSGMIINYTIGPPDVIKLELTAADNLTITWNHAISPPTLSYIISYRYDENDTTIIEQVECDSLTSCSIAVEPEQEYIIIIEKGGTGPFFLPSTPVQAFINGEA